MEDKTNLNTRRKAFYKTRWFMILSLVFFAPLGIYLIWSYSPRGKIFKIIVSLFFGLFFIALANPLPNESAQPVSGIQTSSDFSVSEHTKTPSNISSSEPVKTDNSSESKSEPQLSVSEAASVQSSSSTVSSKTAQSSSSSNEVQKEPSSAAVTSEHPNPQPSSSSAVEASSSSTSQETSRTIDISSEDAKQENISYVWVTATGKKYHSSPSCGNIKHASEVTLQKAQAMGLTPCSKCY